MDGVALHSYPKGRGLLALGLSFSTRLPALLRLLDQQVVQEEAPSVEPLLATVD